MKELKNRQAIVEEIIRMMMEHDMDHTRYQEDIYLYLYDDGTGEVTTFANVGGNSWLNDDHITVYQMPELYTDWTDFVPEIGDIANVLEWDVNTLKERAAAWRCESGWQYDADDMDYQDIRDFLNAHPSLLDQIKDAEETYIKTELYSEYMDKAEMLLDSALEENDDN